MVYGRSRWQYHENTSGHISCATKYCDILHLSGEVRVIIISLSMSKGNASEHRYICRLEINVCEGATFRDAALNSYDLNDPLHLLTDLPEKFSCSQLMVYSVT